jgi:hypothetical protein
MIETLHNIYLWVCQQYSRRYRGIKHEREKGKKQGYRWISFDSDDGVRILQSDKHISERTRAARWFLAL